MKKKKKKLDIPVVDNNKQLDDVKEIIEVEKQKELSKTSLLDITVKILPVETESSASNEIKETQTVPEKEEEREETKEAVNDLNSEPIEIKVEKSFSNNLSNSFDSTEKNNWFIVSASSSGKSHIKSHIPCQDNHFCEGINERWGLAISCDGAGSAAHSQLGSKHVATEIGRAYFKELIIKNAWHEKNILPTQEEWSNVAREGCVHIYNSLEKLANDQQINVTSLACTLIVVIYSPIGLLVTHIGDGRAGYCNEQGEWKALISPHKGEEANQTIFITSKNWITNSNFVMSQKEVPESHVITEKPIAFTLMSDGCELHSFECSIMDKETNKWHDPNRPYSKFFNPLTKNLRSMHESNTDSEKADGKWRKFIEIGNEGLEGEPDDKTMILGILI